MSDIEAHLQSLRQELRRGVLVLAVLGQLRTWQYGYSLIQQLAEFGLDVEEGTLYPLLTRLKNAGLVEYKWVESKSGPPRKYYTLTGVGSHFLTGLTETWEELVHSTNQITQKSKTII